MELREYLYVDADKVRSLLTQLDGGVAEEMRRTEKTTKATTGGIKSVASHERNWGSEEYVQKSLADAIYSDLEEILEVNQLLPEVSETLASSDFWEDGSLQREFPPGMLMRLTGQGALFDARYIAKLFAGIGSTILGLSKIAPQLFESTLSSNSGPSKGKRPPGRKPEINTPRFEQIEDEISNFPAFGEEGQVSQDFLRAFVQIARGVFRPGLHLSLLPCDNRAYAVNMRLQEGRRYLESDPEILFAQYGFSPQEWTVVGTLGSHAPAGSNEVPDSVELSDAFEDGDINRNRFAQGVNSFVEYFARIGFADLPQFPSFSLVPLAVYRTISTGG
ncbi:DUF6414 family protein [Amycolatopsis rifamycinica]|uniref:DUF6414 family protein n=1 Tax=Amycolatopsis rifamycinica TaxID=287986 RepID=UPI00126A5479|nr:hypothetical protein [Amycolatopsis rifamycinica]